MTDDAYQLLFKPVMRKVMEIYQPEAIVFQSGEAATILPTSRAFQGMGPHSHAYRTFEIMALQCSMSACQVGGWCAGADSLAGDRLGAFNLSMKVQPPCASFQDLLTLLIIVMPICSLFSHDAVLACRAMQSASNS